MSSEMEFLDVLQLGVFLILAPSFDRRFYQKKTLPTLIQEIDFAVQCFHSILQIFALRFIIVLDGVPVAVSYVVHRMLAEFAAAAMVLAKGAYDSRLDGEDGKEDEEENDMEEDEDKWTFAMFSGSIERIIQESYSRTFPYYKRCLESSHNHFIWTGPNLQIVGRSDAFSLVIPLATAGELLDHPEQCIYLEDHHLPPPPTLVGKRHSRGDSMDLSEEQPNRKRKC